MSNRFYGKKIKRSRNLYKKRKKPIHKVFEVTGMLAIVALLILVGYAAGKPLLEFLMSEGESEGILQDTYAWTPPNVISSDGLDSQEQTTADNDNATSITASTIAGSGSEETSVPVSDEYAVSAIYAPTSALANSSSLAAYLKKAESEGYNAVVLDLKDNTGNLWYKSGLEQTSTLVKGTLTLKEIISAFDGSGITPIARVNTLQDHLGPKVINDMTYRFASDSYSWLDDYAENGGKQWANPFLSGTRNYISGIVSEAANAGFKEIILANTIFPAFRPYDLSILSAQITDVNSRYSGLSGLVNECIGKKGESRLILEMSLKDVVENYNGYNSTAEILRGKNSINGIDGIMLVFNKSELGTELRTGTSTTTVLPSDMKSLVNTLYKQAARNLGNWGEIVVPCVDDNGISDIDLEQIKTQFEEMGYENYIVK